MSADTYSPSLSLATGLAEPAGSLEAPVEPSSALAGLRERRDKARKQSYLDLRAPGYDDPEVYVRFRALQPGEIDAVNARHEKAKVEERGMRVNSALLARACLGIFNLDQAGEPVGDPATWPRFDEATAGALGVDVSSVQDKGATVVRAFYVDEVDVVITGDRLVAWSLKLDQDLARSAPKD